MRAFWKDIFREIWNTRGRFISLLVITALGAASVVGIQATAIDMRDVADLLYKERSLYDFQLKSTAGFDDDDVAALQKTDGVAIVMPTRMWDAFIDIGNNTRTIRAYALPDTLNKIELLDGRLPQDETECVIERWLTWEHKLGDKITLKSDNMDDYDDILKHREFTIVGVVSSPLFVSDERGRTTIGDGTLNFYMYLHPDAFALEVYTDVYVRMHGSQELYNLSDDYDDASESWLTDIKETGAARVEALNVKLSDAQIELDDARVELDDGWAEYNDGLAEYNDGVAELWDAWYEWLDAYNDAWAELEDAKRKLSDALTELNDGETEYADGLVTFTQEIADAEQKLIDGQAELDDARLEIADGWIEYHDGVAELEKGGAELNDARLLLADAKTELDDGAAQLVELRDGIEQLEAAVVMMPLPQLMAQLEELQTLYDKGMADWENGCADYESGLADYNDGVAELESARLELADALKTLNDGKAELITAQQALDDGRAELEAEREKGQTELNDARVKLEDGWAEYNDGLAEYNKGLDEYNDSLAAGNGDILAAFEAEAADAYAELGEAWVELSDALVELTDGEADYADGVAELADAPEPEWFYFQRADGVAFDSYYQDTQRLQKIGYVFPMVFFLVAVLVSLTTMTRMVEEHRTQIGIYKALGYGPGAILTKYLLYATVSGLVGGVLGVFIGSELFPRIISDAYGHLYNMPPVATPIPSAISALAISAAVLSVVIVTLITCLGATNGVPAELMRPKSPPVGKRVLIERIRPLWNRLSFTGKVTGRNIFRYKKRFIMTLIGVAGCSALLLTAFGLRDSISGVSELQYGKIVQYDAMAYLKDVTKPTQRAEIDSLIRGEHTYMREESLDASGDAGGLAASLVVPEIPSELPRYFSMYATNGGDAATLTDGGVIVTEKLARVMGVKVGDDFTATLGDGRALTLRVTGIAENYVLHYVYMSPTLYAELFGNEPVMNCVMAFDTPDGSAFVERAPENSNVRAVLNTATLLVNLKDSTDALGIVTIVLIVLACALALVVLFNLTNINITERIRELATIKVLGFYNEEVSMYVYRENGIVTLMGIALGIVLGIALHSFVLISVEIDLLKFPLIIKPLSYVYAVILSAVFAVFVNLVMNRKIMRIDMVESLKGVE